MLVALAQAAQCIPSVTAFCVGCVIVSPNRPAEIMATGYSRELSGNTHAEANAIDKLLAASPKSAPELLLGADLYTTLEPCSVRTSGNIPCVKRIIDHGIARVFMGVEEPKDFVECEGVRQLRAAGIQVWVVEGVAQACLEAARRGH